MSSRKSRFLQEEHAQILWEVMVSWWVTKLERKLESAHCESQDWAAEAMEAWVVALLTVERATAAEWGLDAAKVH